MEMSVEYMKKAVELFQKHGFTAEPSVRQIDGSPDIEATSYRLTRGEHEELVLEHVTYTEQPTAYYLQLVRFHGMRSFSFPLDSWKIREHSIELKYYALPDTGLALSITLEL